MVTGPAETVERFVEAARGPGATPWLVDYERIEEDAFHLALRTPPARRSLSVEECRVLARQYRDAIEAHAAAHASARASVAQSFPCPFDLHALVPVPPDVLALGRDHPRAIAWLVENWGVFELRRVVRNDPRAGRRARPGHAKVGYGFWARGGGGPETAIARLAEPFPALGFQLGL